MSASVIGKLSADITGDKRQEYCFTRECHCTMSLLILLAVSLLTCRNIMDVFDGLQCDVGYDWVISELYSIQFVIFLTWI